MSKLQKWIDNNTYHHSEFWDLKKLVKKKEKKKETGLYKNLKTIKICKFLTAGGGHTYPIKRKIIRFRKVRIQKNYHMMTVWKLLRNLLKNRKNSLL